MTLNLALKVHLGFARLYFVLHVPSTTVLVTDYSQKYFKGQNSIV